MSGTDRLRAQYNAWWSEREDAACGGDLASAEHNFAKILRYLGGSMRGRLLDVSCGTGLFLAHLERRPGLELYGMDISDVAIGRARRRLRRAVVAVGDAQELMFADGFFDYVTCVGSLEHFPDPERGTREICRVLGPDGTALILVPNLYFLGHIYMAVRYGVYPSEGGQDFSERFSTLKGWADLLGRGGLRVVGVHKYNEIGATKKVSKALVGLWNVCKPLIPMGLTYHFAFVCEKGPAG